VAIIVVIFLDNQLRKLRQWFKKIHNLTFKDAQINFNSTQFV